MHPFDLCLRVLLPATVTVILVALLVVGWTTETNELQTGFAPLQPIPFSHKLHAGDNQIPCRYCHLAPASSRFAGIPEVETCMNCHRVAKPGTDNITKLRTLYEDSQALKWERVHRLPDHVYFDHRPHLNAGFDCAVCHGEVSTMEVLEQQMPLSMGNCLKCHRHPLGYIANPNYQQNINPKLIGAQNCYACHR